MLIIRTLSCVVLFLAVIWFIKNPDYEPAIAFGTSVIGLIASWPKQKNKKLEGQQNLNVSDNSIGIQAGGNINTTDITNTK